VGLQYFKTGHVPVQNLHETLSTFGWAVAGVFLALQIKFHLMVLGALVAPLATVVVIIASILPGPPVALYPLFKGLWRTFHLGTLTIGVAAFAIACLVGILYLIQEHAIKEKKRGFFFRRLPSLRLLDAMGYSCLIAGFPMLTLGIIPALFMPRSFMADSGVGTTKRYLQSSRGWSMQPCSMNAWPWDGEGSGLPS